MRTLRRTGLGLLELIAVVTLVGILAIVVIPRFTNQSLTAKKNACFVNKQNIEVQCQLWRRQKNALPQSNLSDIGADPQYFPDGLPACPVDGTAYTFDTAAQRVTGHTH
jgi:type II secretory pathway pseudopilin PulG